MAGPIQKFYEAFSNQDIEGMISQYADHVIFSDPAFGTLKGDRAKNMWRMLLESQKGKRFDVTFSNIKEDETMGSANWEAKYNFSQTGKSVHNKISAKFEIQSGKIIKHTDHFDLRSWATQAMGLKGWLFGGTGFFRKKLNQQTNSMLDKYLIKNR